MLIKMKFGGADEIKMVEGLFLTVLIDEQETHILPLIVRKTYVMDMKEIQMKTPASKQFLPSVLWNMLKPNHDAASYYICLDAVKGGGVFGKLVNYATNEEQKILAEDAVMLSLISGIEIYCTPIALELYGAKHSKGDDVIGMPSTILPDYMLKPMLRYLVDREDYEAAKILTDEIKRRGFTIDSDSDSDKKD